MTVPDPLAVADRLVLAGRVADAVGLLTAAGERGDAAALFQLAAWLLIGQPVARDLPHARALLSRAAVLGHADAALIEIALTANGSGAVPDWPGAVRLLKAAALRDPVAAAQADLLIAMDLDGQGRPCRLPPGEQLAGDRIIRFADFATAAECAHLAQCVRDLLAPAAVVEPRTGRQIEHPVRTSHEAVIGPMRESLVVHAINQRLADCSRSTVEQGEPLTILRYAPGQQFRLHHDSIDRSRNQRIATVLLYLNAGYSGGETYFPHYGLTITPRAGDAILFRNVDAQGRPDATMRHAGLAVTRGTKWLATRWIRARPFSPWTGPEAA